MKSIISVFLAWRVGLVIISLIAVNFVPLREGFLGGGTGEYLKNSLVWCWANMDGIHYLSIAKNGYFQYEQAFFPLYPLMIRYLGSLLGNNFLIVGLVISNASFLASLFVFRKLLLLDFKEKHIKWAFALLLLFPASFFFGSVYTEGLFFLLVISSFYFARKEKWLLAGIFGGLASLTRLAGIFLFPALLVEWWTCRGKSLISNQQSAIRQLGNLLPILLIPLGLFIYMYYLYTTTGDPLFFFHAQPAFGANRSGSQLILPPQVIYRYLKILFTASLNFQYVISLIEFLSFFFAVYLLLKHVKKIRLSYSVFAWLCLLVPTLTGSLSSAPRYLLTIFPIYIAFTYERKIVKYIILIVSAMGLILGTMFFLRGYFVS